MEFQGPRDERNQSRWERGVMDGDGLDVLIACSRQPGRAVTGFADRRDSGQHVVKNDTDEEQIAPRVVRANARCTLEADVIDSPLARLAVYGTAGGEAEIDQFGLPARGDEHIRHFQIAVRMSLFCSISQTRK